MESITEIIVSSCRNDQFRGIVLSPSGGRKSLGETEEIKSWGGTEENEIISAGRNIFSQAGKWFAASYKTKYAATILPSNCIPELLWVFVFVFFTQKLVHECL